MALGRLTVDEIVTLAIGDSEEWPPIYKKLGRARANVHRVLDLMYETSRI